MRACLAVFATLAALCVQGCGRVTPEYKPPPGAENNGATGAYSFMGQATWTYQKRDAAISTAGDTVEADAGQQDVGVTFFDL